MPADPSLRAVGHAEITVLGPFTCRLDGRLITPSACKLRKALALLAVRANRFVPFSDLVEELWDEEPPRSVKVTVHSYIARLRALLGDRAGPESVLLTTGHGGYRLGVPPGALDAQRFGDAAAAGDRARITGDLESASRFLRAALAMWRGPALTDVHSGRLLGLHVTRLAEARLATVEHLMEVELGLGRHREILGELTELVTEHPYHENLHGQLMVALYRAARRPRALEVFHLLRGRLADELGLDPSPWIRQLHRAILGDDPALGRTGALRLPAEPPVVRHLPPPAPGPYRITRSRAHSHRRSFRPVRLGGREVG